MGDALRIHAGCSPPAASSPAKEVGRVHASLVLRDPHAPQALAVWLVRNSVPKQLVRVLRVEDARPRTAPQKRTLRYDERREQREHIEGRFRARFDVRRGVHMVGAACDFDVRVRSGGLGALSRGRAS